MCLGFNYFESQAEILSVFHSSLIAVQQTEMEYLSGECSLTNYWSTRWADFRKYCSDSSLMEYLPHFKFYNRY